MKKYMQATCKSSEVIISKAENEEEKMMIYHQRYQITVEEMLQNQKWANHQEKFIKDDLDDSSDIYYAHVDGEIIANMRITWGALKLPDNAEYVYGVSKFSRYLLEEICFTNRLMVVKEWRNSMVLGMLLKYAFKNAVVRGIRLDLTFCTPGLVGLYESLGYRKFKENVIFPDIGFRVPLAFLTRDINYLNKIKSPFLRTAKSLTVENDSGNWFKETFHYVAEMESDFILSNRILKAINLFDGFNDGELQKIVDSSSFLKIESRQTIIREGDASNDLFVVLEGQAELILKSGNQRPVVEMLSVGDVFGELSFLISVRSPLEVRTLTPIKVLVVDKSILQKGIKRFPYIGVKLMHNLSKIICQRQFQQIGSLSLCFERGI